MSESWDDIVFEHEIADAYHIGLHDLLAMLFRYSRQTSDKAILTGDARRAAKAGRYTETPLSLIEAFIAETDLNQIGSATGMIRAFEAFRVRLKTAEVEAVMSRMIVSKGFRPRETQRFISDSLRLGVVINGPGLNDILPPMSPFNPAYFPRKAEAFGIIRDLVEQFTMAKAGAEHCTA